MSNYQVEPAAQPRPSRKRRSSRSATSRSRACHAAPCFEPRSAPPSGCGCSSSARAPSASCGRASPAATRARSRSGPSRRSRPRTPRCRSTRDSRPTTRTRKSFVMLIDPSRQQVHPGHRPERRWDGAQRPRPVPALPAPRLQAEPVPQELLARMPVSRLALRPPRDEGQGRRVRAGTARSMDRFSVARQGLRGALTLDMLQHQVLGLLPVALGEPGAIPPKSPTGRI